MRKGVVAKRPVLGGLRLLLAQRRLVLGAKARIGERE
jgi:hypothetical protein